MQASSLTINLINFLDNNLYNEITIDLLCSTFCYDKSYLMKKFKKETGISIFTYINTMKVYNSLDFYKNDDNILKICLLNGFNSLEYYSEIFKVVIGVNPTTYKKYVKGECSLEEFEFINTSLMRISTYINFINDLKNKVIVDSIPVLKLVA